MNENDWVYRSDRRGGEANFSHINGLNRKENVSVSGGELHVRVDYETLNGKKEFTGGGLITKKRFGYGYYECRYRPFLKGNHGVHCAFWQRGPTLNVLGEQKLDPTTPVENVLFEIDSSEIDNPNLISTNNLYDVISPKEMNDGYPWPCRFHIPIELLPGGWFLDAYEYTPQGIIFYDNGREVARVDYDRIRGQQNVWLTALNGFGKDIDTSVFPGEADFDYFRYYAKDYPGANLLANEGFEYNLDRVDPQNPIAWLEAGDVDASKVVNEGALIGNAMLRLGSNAASKVSTSQTLQYILNGSYTATAMVRSSGGQRVARMRVSGNGGGEKSADIPATSEWKRIVIENIEVKNQSATVGFESDADAGQWLEVDDVQFFKPASTDQRVLQSKPFQAVTDPIWQILQGRSMTFGDGRFGFFGREVGLGGAITAEFTMRPKARAEQVVLERAPKKGESGWGVRLSKTGALIFRIGSKESFTDVAVPNAYNAGEQKLVACVFDNGRATVYLNGKASATTDNIRHKTEDKTAAGMFGSFKTSKEPYIGGLQDIRVFNRALGAEEIAAHAAGAKPQP